jgi:hypothetical protein
MQRRDITEWLDLQRLAEFDEDWIDLQPQTHEQPAIAQLRSESLRPMPCPSRPSAERIEITSRECSEILKHSNAQNFIQALLALERAAARMFNTDLIMETLLDPANNDKLDRVLLGISYAVRLKAALDRAGHRGSRPLRLVDN